MRRKRDWKKRTAQHSQICNKNPTARTQEKNRRFPGVWSVFPTREPEKIPTSRPMSSPDPNPAHIRQILAAPGVRRDREARLWIDGGTARVSFTDREWPRGDARTLEPAREAFRASLVTSTLARAVVGTIIRRVIAPPHIRRRDVAEVERCIVGSTTQAAA